MLLALVCVCRPKSTLRPQKACCKLAPEPRKPLGRRISILHTISTRLGAWSRIISAYGYLFSSFVEVECSASGSQAVSGSHCLIDHHVLCQLVRGPCGPQRVYGPHRSFLGRPHVGVPCFQKPMQKPQPIPQWRAERGGEAGHRA